jgi:Fis family transcriptional regulator
MSTDMSIADCIAKNLERYFHDLEGEKPSAVYEMVLSQMERPMLQVVMAQANGNQTAAADILGINRNTLRRMLSKYELMS